MVFLAGIGRSLLLAWRLHEDFSADDGTDLLVLDAPEPWESFCLVHFEQYWEGEAMAITGGAKAIGWNMARVVE